MPECPKPFRRYHQVPDRSRLVIEIEGEEGEFNAEGWLDSAMPEAHWETDEISPGQVEEELRGNEIYSVRLQIAFLTDTTITISPRIIHPDGVTHSTPCSWSLTAGNGDVAVRGLFISTF